MYSPEKVQAQTLKSELSQTLEKQESVCELCGLAPLLGPAYLMSQIQESTEESLHALQYLKRK